MPSKVVVILMFLIFTLPVLYTCISDLSIDINKDLGFVDNNSWKDRTKKKTLLIVTDTLIATTGTYYCNRQSINYCMPRQCRFTSDLQPHDIGFPDL